MHDFYSSDDEFFVRSSIKPLFILVKMRNFFEMVQELKEEEEKQQHQAHIEYLSK